VPDAAASSPPGAAAPRWRLRVQELFFAAGVLVFVAGGLVGVVGWSRVREAVRAGLEEGITDEMVALLLRYRAQHGEVGDAAALAQAHPALVESICRQRALYLARFGRRPFDRFLRDRARWAILTALGFRARELYRALHVLTHAPDEWCGPTPGAGAGARAGPDLPAPPLAAPPRIPVR
jgi:hypothetical protein